MLFLHRYWMGLNSGWREGMKSTMSCLVYVWYQTQPNGTRRQSLLIIAVILIGPQLHGNCVKDCFAWMISLHVMISLVTTMSVDPW